MRNIVLCSGSSKYCLLLFPGPVDTPTFVFLREYLNVKRSDSDVFAVAWL